MSDLRHCKRCNRDLPDVDFFRNRKHWKQCNVCNTNNEKHKEAKKKYRDEHKEERVKYDKEYRMKNPEKKKAQQDAYLYRPEVRERNRQRAKAWYKEHGKKQEVKDRKNKYRREKTATDINYKIKSNLRCRLQKAVAGTCKSAPTLELLGCSVENLKKWLEDRFKEGMSWDNYGEWHIDHILPCASFNLLDPEQQRLCFNYKNLQPLWASENMSKGSKIIE